MNSNSRQESAKIYAFPRRAADAGARDLSHERAAAELRTLRVVPVAFGSGWYHEAAVQEEQRSHKP